MKTKLDIWATPDRSVDGGIDYQLVQAGHAFMMSNSAVKVGETTVRFSPPNNMTKEEFAFKAIKTLTERQQDIRAKAEVECQSLQKQIDNLLMLTHQPAVDDFI